jgi:hypothetical protein
MSYYPEKPKNDFSYGDLKRYPDYSPPRERGGCLTLFLLVIMAANAFVLFSLCSDYSQLNQYSHLSGFETVRNLFLFGFVVQFVILSCAVALWNWKKWGYYGLICGYVLGIGLNLCGGNVLLAIGSSIGLAILAFLVNPKIEMFD